LPTSRKTRAARPDAPPAKPAEPKRDRRRQAKPPAKRGVKGQDSIKMQPGLREFLDALHDERVTGIEAGSEGDEAPVYFSRRLTVSEIHERVRLSGFQLSRWKVGVDRLEQEIQLSEQRRIISAARTIVANGGDQVLTLQAAANQVATAKIFDELQRLSPTDKTQAAPFYAAANAAVSLELSAARRESVRLSYDRGVKRATDTILSEIQTLLKNDNPKLLAELQKVIELASAKVKEARA
jgi:hypothetical protein